MLMRVFATRETYTFFVDNHELGRPQKSVEIYICAHVIDHPLLDSGDARSLRGLHVRFHDASTEAFFLRSR